MLQYSARVDGDTLRFATFGVDRQTYPYPNITGSGSILWWNVDDGVPIAATAVWNVAESALDVTFASAVADELTLYFHAWQEELRGPNGEWFAPGIFFLTPP